MVHVELGWQPIQMLIGVAKLRFLKQVSSPSFSESRLGSPCMIWNKENRGTLYMKNLEEVLLPYLSRPEDDVAGLMVCDLWLHHEVDILGLIQGLVLLRVMPIPLRWWKPSPHLEDARWSRV